MGLYILLSPLTCLELRVRLFSSEFDQIMNNLTDYIVSLCQQLQSEGKVPSVATIRNKSDRTLPLPEVIRVLKRWQEDPNSVRSSEHSFVESLPMTTEQRLTNLEQQMENALQAITALQAQIDDLLLRQRE